MFFRRQILQVRFLQLCNTVLILSSPPEIASESIERIEQNALAADRWIRRRGGWVRILRNTVIGYVEQAGSRMAAALSYYSIFVGGPVLVLTLLVGSALFGEEATREAVTEVVGRVLPPDAEGADVARQIVRTSTPTASMALLIGVSSLLGFTRALATSLNVTLNTSGVEPFKRTFLVGPLLLFAVLGLLWGAWSFKLLVELVQAATGAPASELAEFLVTALVPLLLAIGYFVIILAVVPRTQLSRSEVLVPATLGAILWESARHIFGWLVRSDSTYLRVFGPLGGVVALLGWVYLSSAILVLTGQLAWAYAMERRGRGHLAGDAPRQAGLEGWTQPFVGDNAVNE
jgi:membrane protein